MTEEIKPSFFRRHPKKTIFFSILLAPFVIIPIAYTVHFFSNTRSNIRYMIPADVNQDGTDDLIIAYQARPFLFTGRYEFGVLDAVDLKQGKRLWSSWIRPIPTRTYGPKPRQSILVANETIFLLTKNKRQWLDGTVDHVSAYSVKTGELVWRFPFKKTREQQSALLLYKNKLILYVQIPRPDKDENKETAEKEAGILYVLDINSGKVLYRQSEYNTGFRQPYFILDGQLLTDWFARKDMGLLDLETLKNRNVKVIREKSKGILYVGSLGSIGIKGVFDNRYIYSADSGRLFQLDTKNAMFKPFMVKGVHGRVSLQAAQDETKLNLYTFDDNTLHAIKLPENSYLATSTKIFNKNVSRYVPLYLGKYVFDKKFGKAMSSVPRQLVILDTKEWRLIWRSKTLPLCHGSTLGGTRAIFHKGSLFVVNLGICERDETDWERKKQQYLLLFNGETGRFTASYHLGKEPRDSFGFDWKKLSHRPWMIRNDMLYGFHYTRYWAIDLKTKKNAYHHAEIHQLPEAGVEVRKILGNLPGL